MKSMFTSATLKLTGWYLLIIMTVSIVFSVAIFHISYNEIERRLENYQQVIFDPTLFFGQTFKIGEQMRVAEASAAAANLVQSLVYVNLVVLVLGGAGSYVLARRTLGPIEEAHEAQSRFTSDASHELRTPLAAMKMELEVALSDTQLSAKEAKVILTSTLEETNKLIGISELFLQLARLDFATLQRETVDITQCWQSSINRRPKAQQKRIQFTAPSAMKVTAHPAALEEVASVVLDNALKHSPASSTVIVSISKKKGFSVIEVSNDGTIPQDALPHIFERFYKVDSSRTDSVHKGYGLGLAIAKRITDLHGGTIQIRNHDTQVVTTVCIPLTKKA